MRIGGRLSSDPKDGMRNPRRSRAEDACLEGKLTSENLSEGKRDYLPEICNARSPEGMCGADATSSKNGRMGGPRTRSVWIKRETDGTR